MQSSPSRRSRRNTRPWKKRDVEKNGVLQTCEELGIGFVPCGPIGMGYLSRRVNRNTTLDTKTDLRFGLERFNPENIAASMPIIELLKRCAAKKNATPSQLALAWLLAQKPFILLIPGTRNMNHLQASVHSTSNSRPQT